MKSLFLKRTLVIPLILFFSLLFSTLSSLAEEIPAGYNEEEYIVLKDFLELEFDGVKNGSYLDSSYDPGDPTSWRGVTWTGDSPKSVQKINWCGTCSELAMQGELVIDSFSSLLECSLALMGITRFTCQNCPLVSKIDFNNNEEQRALKITNLPLLNHLSCRFGQVEELDIVNCPAIKYFYITDQELTTIDLTAFPELIYVMLGKNKLTNLKANNLEKLLDISCEKNQIKSLDLSGCSALESISCYNNELTYINIEDCVLLKYLQCPNNFLTELDVGMCAKLHGLNCFNNELTKLVMGYKENIQYIACYNNLLTSLDVSECNGLKYLECEDCEISSLKIDPENLFRDFFCQNNRLTFSSMPNPKFDEWSPQKNFSPQKDMLIKASGRVCHGEKIDLSQEADVNGCATEYLWSDDEGTSLSLDEVETGIFLVSEEVLGKTIVCQLLNNESVLYTISTAPIIVVEPLKPTITEEPMDALGVIDGQVSFSLVVSENDYEIAYQWEEKALDKESWQELAGKTEKKLVLENLTLADKGKKYRCRIDLLAIKPAEFTPLYSKEVNLDILAEVVIEENPRDLVALVEGKAIFTLLARAADSEQGGKLHYQWQKSTDENESWENIDGAQAANLELKNLNFLKDNASYYRCLVYNSREGIKSKTLGSQKALLTVLRPPEITSQPQAGTFLEGDELIMEVQASLDEGASLSYQWQVKKGEASWQDIEGANDSQYKIRNLTSADHKKEFRCLLKNLAADLESLVSISEEVLVYVVIEPQITKQPLPSTVKIGDRGLFEVIIEDLGFNLDYQWETFLDGEWQELEGAKEASYMTPAASLEDEGQDYRCRISHQLDNLVKETISDEAKLYVVADPEITQEGKDQEIAFGQAVIFSIKAKSNDGGTLTYAWQSSEDEGISWQDIEGASENQYSLGQTCKDDHNKLYRCLVRNLRHDVSSNVVSSQALRLTLTLDLALRIVRPQGTSSEEEPLISGKDSLVILEIDGNLAAIASLTIRLDEEDEVALSTKEIVCYLLGTNLKAGEHSILVTLIDVLGGEISKEVNFYWQIYRKGFGFGRLNF